MSRTKTLFGYLLIAVVIIAIDQSSKIFVNNHLRYGEVVEVLPFFNWTLAYNRGAAFSFLSQASGWQHYVFVSLALLVSGYIIFWLLRHATENKLLSWAYTLVLAGAVGNVIDRLLYRYVIDFIQLHYQGWFFPSFNVADMAITCGAVLLIWDSFFHRQDSVDINETVNKRE